MVMKKTSQLIFPMFLLLSALAAVAEDEDKSEPHPIQLKDIMEWKTIWSAAFSSDGQWFGYRIVPNEGNSSIVIKSTSESKEYRFPDKEDKDKSYSRFTFSDDSKWAVVVISPDWKEQKKLEKDKKPIHNDAVVLNLDSGATKEFKSIQGYSFPKESSTWLALKKYPPESKAKDDEADSPKGSDVLLWELGTENRLTFSKVPEYAFNKNGEWFAWIVSSEDKESNSVQIRNMTTGVVLPIDHGEFVYKGLTWNEEGDGLAFLKGKEDEDYEEPFYSVIGLKGFEQESPAKHVYDPNEDDSFPDEMTVSPNRSPVWTDDLTAISFGIHETELTEEAKKKKEKEEQEKEDKKEDIEEDTDDDAEKTKKDKVEEDVRKDEEDDEENGDDKEDKGKKEKSEDESEDKDKEKVKEKPGVVIWHWKDKRLQSRQQKEEKHDKDFSYLCIYHVDENKFVRLANDEVKDVSLTPKQKWAIGINDESYELMANLDGKNFKDIYAIDLKTGFYRLAVKQCRWEYGPSFEGTAFLYYRDGHFYVYNMDSNQSTNITKDLDTSFIDETHGRNIEDPPISPWSYGWVKGGKSVLLYDNWDVWQVFTDGSGGVNLTKNGKEEKIRYQSRFKLDPDEKGIDLSKGLYLRMYGEWTKKGGIALIDPATEGVQVLHWDDALFSNLIKAEDEDVYAFTRETYKEPPHYQLADSQLKASTQLTEDLRQMDDVLWSEGSILIDYESDKGDKLQASLHMPTNYEKGETYPTIVYIYERLSQRHHGYQNPRLGFSKSVYTSNGYAVLMPDIEYQLNDPGMSAVWCLVPAVEAALDTGVVDRHHLGLHGHSWGGYQTSFVITQTNLFRAAIAGAPLTNMISMYSSVYWNVGYANQPIFESSQGRFKGGYWDYLDAYQRNSPIYFARNVNTSLLLLHNDQDGAVDWNQGIEYYNTLRRLGKPVVMLQYKGEKHGVTKMENQKDYFLRMKEFWDHHLKGEEAPDWWSEGVKHLDLKDHIDERMRLMD
jgi:dipeptidyl aminopeptidase/acylaminoacyl peptidase